MDSLAVECDICYENYNASISDRIPRLLFCGHSFCQGCIVGLFSAAEEMVNGNISILCPCCRQPTMLPACEENAVANHLIKNIELLRVQDDFERQARQNKARQQSAERNAQNAMNRIDRIQRNSEILLMKAEDRNEMRGVGSNEHQNLLFAKELIQQLGTHYTVWISGSSTSGSWIAPYTRYTIVIHKKHNTFGPLDDENLALSKVFRRYTDFVWLNAQLEVEANSCGALVLPSLPDKQFMKLNRTVVCDRLLYLQAYLRQIISNPIFQQSESLRAFLLLPTEELNVVIDRLPVVLSDSSEYAQVQKKKSSNSSWWPKLLSKSSSWFHTNDAKAKDDANLSSGGHPDSRSLSSAASNQLQVLEAHFSSLHQHYAACVLKDNFLRERQTKYIHSLSGMAREMLHAVCTASTHAVGRTIVKASRIRQLHNCSNDRGGVQQLIRSHELSLMGIQHELCTLRDVKEKVLESEKKQVATEQTGGIHSESLSPAMLRQQFTTREKQTLTALEQFKVRHENMTPQELLDCAESEVTMAVLRQNKWKQLLQEL